MPNLFELSVDKQNNSIVAKREFAAKLPLVWDAWTKPEILDQWWAPRPYRTVTKSMDFREGGTWLYSMISPKNETHWCKADYKGIKVNEQILWLDAFCDENGKENTVKPRSLWTINFSESNDVTTVDVTLQHESLKDLETMVEMGFNEGFTMGLGNLDEVLLTLSKK